ncbi:MAG: 16S rRNA (cytosine(1402)-N(4))-methyltransferase RsmH [Kangiellaceae bacterium]|nr:16S rRNA (cytosine(1402)-N(4))-methyltransferase RsmH [Kangiellaceae bacterium]
MKPKQSHITVLLNEAVDGLNIKPDGIYLDGTFGRGGHSRLILEKLGVNGRLIGIDRDLQAVQTAKEFEKDSRFSFFHQNFANIKSLLEQQGLLNKIDGILLDLGVSSPQLDQAERGFSFSKDGPLDMRMDTSKGISAQDWINSAAVEDMKKVFKEYGEEKFSLRIARGIEAYRSEKQITGTLELANIIDKACPVKDKFKHPATRTFQAIRIFINDELGEIRATLQDMYHLLASGGRMSVISFHSLEDRIVKRFIKSESQGIQLPKEIPVLATDMDIKFKKIGKAIKASKEEVVANPRSRSAILRIAEKF